MTDTQPGAPSDRAAYLEELRLAEDVLLRFAEGQDRNDKDLFASSFSDDAEMDFIQPATVFDIELDVFKGKAAIVDTVFRNIETLRTSHTVTNQRIGIQGEHATGTALVEAQHVDKRNRKQFLLLKNFYDFDLVKTDGRWVMSRVVIRNIWYVGRKSVLFR